MRESMRVACGNVVRVGDLVRITGNARNAGPPIGTLTHVVDLSDGTVRVEWPFGVSGTYGKLPFNVEKANDPDTEMDEGL